jgi:hypothetical protein
MRQNLDPRSHPSGRPNAKEIQVKPALEPEGEPVPIARVFVQCKSLLFQSLNINLEHCGETLELLQTGVVITFYSLNRPGIQAGHLGQLFLREMSANP